MDKQTLINRICNRKAKSAWMRGVLQYAVDILQDVDLTEVSNVSMLKKAILNGADSWEQYSEGGCALCYDGDICERLCPPSIVKIKHQGLLPPNNRASWIQLQARALKRAAWIIERESKYLFETEN